MMLIFIIFVLKKCFENFIYFYFVDKFWKKDVEDILFVFYFFIYLDIFEIINEEFEVMVLYLFVNSCISCLSSFKMNNMDK